MNGQIPHYSDEMLAILWADLEQVVTEKEIQSIWQVTDGVLSDAIKNGMLCARNAMGTWLYQREQVNRFMSYRGIPKR